MHSDKIKNIVMACALAVLGLASCDDPAEHYDGGRGGVESQTVGGYLDSKPEYRFFADLLRKHGYMDSVSNGRPVTVFLPKESALNAYNISEDSMKSVLAYHIGNTQLYTSGMDEQPDQYVKTLYNGKNIWATKVAGSGLSLDRMVESAGEPVFCENGVVYFLEGALAPKKNLFESIREMDDEYAKYKSVALKDTLILDRDKSFPIGVDKYGQTIYDSVFYLGYKFLNAYGNLNGEDLRYSNLVYSDQAVESAYDRMVERYYTSAENLPDYFEDEEGFVDKVKNKIIESSIFAEKTEGRKAGDTIMATNGIRLIMTAEWFAKDPERYSNGLSYSINRPELLMSHVMGRTVTHELGFQTGLTAGLIGQTAPPSNGFEEDPSRTPVSNEATGDIALHFRSENPFWVEYKLDASMAGHHRVVISGVKGKSGQSAVFVDGELIDPRYTPSGSWNNDFVKILRFSEFGERTIRFEVTDPKEILDDDNEPMEVYELCLNKLFFVPVKE
ncbi:hypothetical protein FUAX_20720 [Fulvitalea axinellae]|uniref:FAS1 domain-containing protein n=1 Tax=Fulvitalea axinellae TaxID=1182444 RepID=A0AAU9DFA7_9BACT|nr:hypothetical protein FUAX_20720 [Fulvitalea axinellae]